MNPIAEDLAYKLQDDLESACKRFLTLSKEMDVDAKDAAILLLRQLAYISTLWILALSKSTAEARRETARLWTENIIAQVELNKEFV